MQRAVPSTGQQIVVIHHGEISMRLIALSIVIFSGACMASVAYIVNALPNARQYSGELSTCGMLLIGGASILFVVEWFAGFTGQSRPAKSDLPLA